MNTFVGKGAGKYVIKRLFNAKRQALICSPYLSKPYAEAIVKMVERGVNVKLITSNEKTRNFHAHAYIMKYSQTNGQKGSLDFTIVGSSFIHAKMYVADDDFAAFGSANLTIAGMWENVENIVTYDGAEGISIRKGFERIWKYNSKGIANGKERGDLSISAKTS